MQHIGELSATTEELAAFTEDVLSIYEDNKEKAFSTKRVIDDLEIAIENLV